MLGCSGRLVHARCVYKGPPKRPLGLKVSGTILPVTMCLLQAVPQPSVACILQHKLSGSA